MRKTAPLRTEPYPSISIFENLDLYNRSWPELEAQSKPRVFCKEFFVGRTSLTPLWRFKNSNSKKKLVDKTRLRKKTRGNQEVSDI